MPAARHTPEQKAAALAAYREFGPAEAARRTGIRKNTITSWALRSGVQSVAPEGLARATEVARVSRELRVAELAEDLLEIARARAARLRQSITADSERELAQVIGLAVEKSQLLAGQATSRVAMQPEELRRQVEDLRDTLERRLKVVA